MGAGSSVVYSNLPAHLTRDKALQVALELNLLSDETDFPAEKWNELTNEKSLEGEATISRNTFLNLYEEFVRDDLEARKDAALDELKAQNEGGDSYVDPISSSMESEFGDKPSSSQQEYLDANGFRNSQAADVEIIAQDGETELFAQLGHGTFTEEEPEDDTLPTGMELLLPVLSLNGKKIATSKGHRCIVDESQPQSKPYDPYLESAEDEFFAADGEAFENSEGPGVFDEDELGLESSRTLGYGPGLAVVGISPSREALVKTRTS